VHGVEPQANGFNADRVGGKSKAKAAPAGPRNPSAPFGITGPDGQVH
jgi:hypothetical protein